MENFSEQQKKYMQMAIDLAEEGMKEGRGGPFGAVVVKAGRVIGSGSNEVIVGNDPTAHAEVVAIRRACAELGNFQLDGCEIYASCEPCPMCLGAIYWARPAKVYFALTRADAARMSFDDQFIYEEIEGTLENRKIPFVKMEGLNAEKLMVEWANLQGKIQY